MSVIWCARAWLVTPYRLRMVKNCQTLVLLSECRSANAAVRVPQCECRSASAAVRVPIRRVRPVLRHQKSPSQPSLRSGQRGA